MPRTVVQIAADPSYLIFTRRTAAAGRIRSNGRVGEWRR